MSADMSTLRTMLWVVVLHDDPWDWALRASGPKNTATSIIYL